MSHCKFTASGKLTVIAERNEEKKIEIHILLQNIKFAFFPQNN